MSTGMRVGAGRVAAPKQVYRKPTFEMVMTPRGMRKVPRDGCWRSRLHQIIDQHGRFKEDAATLTSHSTRDHYRSALMRLFEVLHKQFPFEDPQRFDYRHLVFLERWMEARYENHVAGVEPSLSPDTIANYLSYLRTFCRWLKQYELESLVGETLPAEVSGRRMAAQKDKSWEGNGIDIAAKIDEAYEMEPTVGMALLAQASLGLRRKESLCLVPARDWDGNRTLNIVEGAKGGRARSVFLFEDAQVETLAVLCAWLAEEQRPGSAIGAAGGTLEQNLVRYMNVLRRIGMTKELAGTTGHGLRAGFVCRMLEAWGVKAPVRGGDVASVDRETRRNAYRAATEAAGHSRLSVVSAYAGSTKPRPELFFKDCPPPDLLGMIERIKKHREQDRHHARVMRMELNT